MLRSVISSPARPPKRGHDGWQRAREMHAMMPSDGKEELLQQPSRETHNRRQAAVFDAKAGFFASDQATPAKVMPSLRRIAEACRLDGSEDDGTVTAAAAGRVVDVGCGTGALVNFLKEAGVAERSVVGVDVSPKMANLFRERFPEAEVVNADFIDFAETLIAARGQTPPAEEDREEHSSTAAVGVVTFNAMFGNLWNQAAALERAAEILEESGRIVISHPLGRDFVRQLKGKDDTVVPHELPDQDELLQLVQFLPLSLESFESEKELYLAVLKKMPHRACETVRYLRGEVSRGYGRGSKKLGIPTANLLESQFAANLRSLPTGVYFGWASLEKKAGGLADNISAAGPRYKCVANVGYSPTFVGKENAEKIVEGHLIGYDGDDFYEQTMRMVLVGFQRFERKFGSLPELVATINKDVSDVAKALDEDRFAVFKEDSFLSASSVGNLEAWSTKEFGVAVEEAAAVPKT